MNRKWQWCLAMSLGQVARDSFGVAMPHLEKNLIEALDRMETFVGCL